MRKLFIAILCSLAFCISLSAQDSEAYLKVLNEISDNVFEVVVEKKEDSDITYIEELPWDLVPYKIRNDKYFPIGTAFLMQDGNFYTAFHVMDLTADSVFDDYYLRDADENIWKITDIVGFSSRKDYICFKADGYDGGARGLKAAEKAKINTQVYSVGNALGDGIVVRDGLLTSRTYEDRDGEWKWLRFSAAANFGNSGGPLVNESGEVLGIIVMKNKSENLNYAISMDDIRKDEPNKGVFDNKSLYVMPNLLNYKHDCIMRNVFQLPKRFSDLKSEVSGFYKGELKKVIGEIKSKFGPDGSESFARSNEKDMLLFSSYNEKGPVIIYRNGNGNWDYDELGSSAYNGENNSRVLVSSALGYYFADIRKPDGVSLKEFMANPKNYADMMCLACQVNRSVGNKKVIISSLGDPDKVEEHVDYFGRKWTVSHFNMDFADSMIVIFALPTPQGVFVAMNMNSRAEILTRGGIDDMKFVMDFVHINYSAKLKEWQEFFETDISSIPNFNGVSISRLSSRTEFDLPFMSLGLDGNEISVSDDSVLSLDNSYVVGDEGKVRSVWSTFALDSPEDSDESRSVIIYELKRPVEGAREKIMQTWSRYVNRNHPYDGVPFAKSSANMMMSVLYDENDPDFKCLHLIVPVIEEANSNDKLVRFNEHVLSNIRFY